MSKQAIKKFVNTTLRFKGIPAFSKIQWQVTLCELFYIKLWFNLS